MEDMTGHPRRCCRRTTPFPRSLPTKRHTPGGQGGHLAANGRPLPPIGPRRSIAPDGRGCHRAQRGKGKRSDLDSPAAGATIIEVQGGRARHAAALAKRSTTHGKPGTTLFHFPPRAGDRSRPCRTTTDPRLGSPPESNSASASETLSPALHNTAISARRPRRDGRRHLDTSHQ